MFFKKQPVDLLQEPEFIKLRQRITNCELDLEKYKTQLNSLRGLFNRRKAKGEDLTEEEEEEEENINKEVSLPI